MDSAVYFGVVRRHGQDSPRLFYDWVPSERGLIYCTRLDNTSWGGLLLGRPLRQMMVVYARLVAAGRLPPEDRGGKPKKEARGPTTISRERWQPPAARWDRYAPAYPPLPGAEGWAEYLARCPAIAAAHFCPPL